MPFDTFDEAQSLPKQLHLCLLILIRSYIILLLALASQQQSAQLLELFYPDPNQLYWGLLLGSPALLCWLAGAYRQREGHPFYHGFWRRGRWLCSISAFGELILQLHILSRHHWSFDWQQASLLSASLWSCSYLLFSSQLATTFSTAIDKSR
jgi:Protein of unknown function (DUF2919).